MATQTGLQIATGKASPSKELEAIGKTFGTKEKTTGNKEKEDLDAGLLVAAGGVLTVAGLLFALLGVAGSRAGGGFSSVLAMAALVCLLAQWQSGFPMEKSFRGQDAKTLEGNPEALLSGAGAVMAAVQLKPQPAFYGTLGLLGFSTLLLVNAGLDRLRVRKLR